MNVKLKLECYITEKHEEEDEEEDEQNVNQDVLPDVKFTAYQETEEFAFLTLIHVAVRNVHDNYGDMDSTYSSYYNRVKNALGILNLLLEHGADSEVKVPEYGVCNIPGKKAHVKDHA